MSRHHYNFLASVFIPLLLIFIVEVRCDHWKTTHDSSQLLNGKSLEQLNEIYDALYSSMKTKEYGFAKFGQPCDPISSEDLDDLMELGRLIIKDQEEDGDYRRTVEEHLRPKLKYFFDRSKIHCDFHRFLICHKRQKTCSCPHSTMGIGRDGACGYNLGKRCDFSQNKLSTFGLNILTKEKANISCLGDAECVSSFGAASKICRCPIGYRGSNCKTSIYSSVKAAAAASSISGRAAHFGNISTVSDGRDFWETNDSALYLFPNEIKSELVKMMNLRNMFDPGEREKEAETLYSKMDSDPDKEDMVIKDIHIRHFAHLNMSETCEPKKQAIVDNPPLASEGTSWVDPDPKLINQWQTSLLVDGQPFCNFIAYYECDLMKQICRCKAGLEFESGRCVAKVGTGCGPDYESTFEFDILKDRKRFSPPYSPPCSSGYSCQSRPLFFVKQCWCPENPPAGRNCPEEGNLVELIKTVGKRMSLNLGEACDPEKHAELLNPQDSHRTQYAERIQRLNQLLADPDLRFCNLDNFLKCSVNTSKCECFENLAEQNKTCRIKNMDSCEEAYILGRDLYTATATTVGSKMWKVEEIFDKKFVPLCVRNGVCNTTTLKCECSNGMGGATCEDTRSLLAQVLSPFKIQGYNVDTKINNVFYALNLYTAKVEERIVKLYGDDCDPEMGEKMKRIIRFYRQVGHSDENISGTKTLHQYKKVVMWLSDLLVKIGATLDLCNVFHGLVCHHTGKCHCDTGFISEDKVCKLQAGQQCDENPQAPWIPRCRNHTECIPAGYNFKTACVCSDGWTGEHCQDPVGDISTDPTIEKNPPQEDKVDDPVENKTIDYFEEMDEMLKEIINHRNIQLNSTCEPSQERNFTGYFPMLPKWDQSAYQTLPQGPLKSYYYLRTTHTTGIGFCDRKQYLICVGKGSVGTCTCSSEYNLVQEGNLCRLGEYSYCGEINTIYNKEYPIPLCKTGTKCTKQDYGMYKCRKTPSSNEVF